MAVAGFGAAGLLGVIVGLAVGLAGAARAMAKGDSAAVDVAGGPPRRPRPGAIGGDAPF